MTTGSTKERLYALMIEFAQRHGRHPATVGALAGVGLDYHWNLRNNANWCPTTKTVDRLLAYMAKADGCEPPNVIRAP